MADQLPPPPGSPPALQSMPPPPSGSPTASQIPPPPTAPPNASSRAQAALAGLGVPTSVNPVRRFTSSGRKVKLAIGTILVLIAAAVGGNAFASSVSSPASVAVAYVAAEGKNDASALWSDSLIQTQAHAGNPVAGGQNQAQVQLLSEQDLAAMLALPANRNGTRSNIRVTQLSMNSGTAVAAVTYDQGSGRGSESLTLQEDQGQKRFLFYPLWRVVVNPIDLSINLPSSTSRVLVDGTELQLGTSNVWVFPGIHSVKLLASGIFGEDTELVKPGTGQVAFNLKLTASAEAAASAPLSAFFKQCAQQTSFFVGNCPQSFYARSAGPVTWTLIGDPTSTLSLSLDSSGKVIATGHYLMTVSYPGTAPSGTYHNLSGGPFSATLTWDGSSFAVDSVRAGFVQVPALQDPGADHTAILSAVHAAFVDCAKSTALGGTPDCPQLAYAYAPTAVHWQLAGDPTSGASIQWNGDIGVYEVSGSYSLNATYTNAYGKSASSPSTGTSYKALVIWDKGQAQVVRIAGS